MDLVILDPLLVSNYREIKMSIEWWYALNPTGKKQVRQLYFESERSLDGNIVQGYRSTLELVENVL